MPNLIKDSRLNKIYEMVDCPVVADIGTDHGKLVGQLFVDDKIEKAYLTDISEKSLSKAKSLMQKLNCLDKSTFIVSDGFDNMHGINENYQAIIAGMGGEEIIKILSKNKNKKNIESFILQPQKNVVNLREYLINNGYKIEKDVAVQDGTQFYFIIKAVFGADILSYEELHFGRTNLQQYSQDFVAYLNYQKALYDEILNSAKNFGKDKQMYYDTLVKCIKKGESKC